MKVAALAAFFFLAACGQGETSIGVGAGGLAIVDTDDALITVNPGVGVDPETVIPLNCPVLASDGSVLCSCDSLILGEC